MATKQTPWAVLLCKFKDNQTEPELLEPPSQVPNFRRACDLFFTASGVGTFNAVQFFSDMSHGSLDLSGSQVFGWLTLDLNVNDVLLHQNSATQNAAMVLAKKAALDAGVPLGAFFGVVLIMNIPTGWAQGNYAFPGVAPAPGVVADCRRVNGQGNVGIGFGNGTEVFGQEMGHAYGLGHSRRDGSGEDYQDRWDIMSTANAFSEPDPAYAARGPGLNAWNMRGRGWLDESRVWRAQGDGFDQVVELRPLHRRDLPGWLAAELPPNEGEGGHGRYLVEFRIKEAWDAGIPRSTVLVHRFNGAPDDDGWPHSYIMSGANGQQELVKGDVFAPGPTKGVVPRLEVLEVNHDEKTATVRLSSMSFRPTTNVAPGATAISNRVFVFGKDKGLDGRIFFNQAVLDQAFLPGWIEVQGDGRTDAPPSAVSIGNRLFVFVKGLDGRIFFNQAVLDQAFLPHWIAV